MSDPLPGNRWLSLSGIDADVYDARYEARAAAGEDVHGEAAFVAQYPVRTVLDAGCGTGRVARELARRGYAVVGVDIDARMLETAQRKAPALEWYEADLAALQLNRRFDAILLAGNVMLFLAPGSEGAVMHNLADHLNPGALLIAGFQLQAGRLTIGRYDALAEEAGLELSERWSTWQRAPWQADDDYAVSVHRLRAAEQPT